MSQLTDWQRRNLPTWRRQRALDMQPWIEAVDGAIEKVGWAQSEPVVAHVIYGDTGLWLKRSGSWRRKMGKRQARKILETLGKMDRQLGLFES